MESFRINTLLIVILSLLLITCKPKDESASNFKSDADYQLLGDSISMASFAAIRSALMGAIEEGGLEHAISFCKLEAIPLTDSMSNKYNVMISRISDKSRNELNAASIDEILLIEGYQQKSISGNTIIKGEQGETVFYKAIVAQAFCLNCHGSPGKELSITNQELILANYPNDKAVGYKENDIRGLWKIVFNQ